MHSINHGDDVEYGVFELGMSAPGEMRRLCRILKPDVGIVTKVARAHTENFNSIDEIAREKATLLSSISPSGFGVVDVDGAWMELFEEQAASRLVTVSMAGHAADYRADPAWYQPGQLEVQESEYGPAFTYRMPLPGRYVMENALKVIALARECGLSPAVIHRALIQFKPSSMRWEPRMIRGILFINDAYNANADAMKAAASAFEEMPQQGRKWLVLGGMLELGEKSADQHREVGAYMAEGPWKGMICVGALAADIANGGKSADFRVLTAAHIDEAVAQLHDFIRPGDAVLVKASRGEHLEDVIDKFDNIGLEADDQE